MNGPITKPVFTIAAILLAFAADASAKDAVSYRPDCKRIASFLDAAVKDSRTVGASALVWKDGAERCFAVTGQAEREGNRLFARDTLVQAFSMTKPVTGVALMQLWEQGKFGLDDPLFWHLPQFANVQVLVGENADGSPILRAPKRPITVRDVLRHTAGFTYGAGGNPQNAADRVWEELSPLSPDKTLAQFADAMAKVPLLYDPGTHWP